MLDAGAVVSRLLVLAPRAVCYWVALSGGRDSCALLHALAERRGELPGELRALHVDHGLHPQARSWAERCRALCDRLDVPLRLRRVSVEEGTRSGQEAAARQARYEAFAAELSPQDCLVQAHHADDQAETFLFRALRGGGLNGLSAIPPRRTLGSSTLARPLLAWPRSAVTAYAEHHGLAWAEDPANTDEAYDRVFLRRRVMPVLAQRWPDAARRLAAGVGALRADRELLAAYLDEDLAEARRGHGRPSVSALAKLAPRRRLAVLRRWLEVSGCRPPPRRRLEEGVRSLMEASADAQPELEWADGCVRRYRGRLYLLPPEGERPGEGPPGQWQWHGQASLPLPGGVLRSAWSPGPALCPELAERGLYARFRADLGDSSERRRAQRLCQRLGIPPWERGIRPFLWLDHRPVAIAGVGVAPGYTARPGVRVDWDAPSSPV